MILMLIFWGQTPLDKGGGFGLFTCPQKINIIYVNNISSVVAI